MMRPFVKKTVCIGVPAAVLACLAFLLFAPKGGAGYRLKVAQGQGVSAVSRTLARDNAVYSRYVFLAAAHAAGLGKKIHAGNYRLPAHVSTWQIVQRLRDGKPDTVTVRIVEGSTFRAMRRAIAAQNDLRHDTATWSDIEILRRIDPDSKMQSAEGLFFPDSYDVDTDSSDLTVYRMAYREMQKRLQSAWEERRSGLPYQTPYELLTMASLIEKETGHPQDRAQIASVFVNRLNKGMRLQTDPSVIYGMGSAYKGKIGRADLRRDTPYNTYTRAGLPPTPIALPGRAALEAAAHPAHTDYLYFVAKNDGSGESSFSRNLDEHNAAVRQYILKKGP